MHSGAGDVAVDIVVLGAGEDWVEVGEGRAVGGFGHQAGSYLRNGS